MEKNEKGVFTMYSSSYGKTSSSLLNSATSEFVWIIISLILAIVGGLVVYFVFLSKKNEGKFTGFLGWLYDFLSFKKMTLEAILKVTYLMVAIYITLSSFALIGTSFIAFLVQLIVGNVITRLVYEFSLILLVICRNTTEINKKLTDQNKKD